MIKFCKKCGSDKFVKTLQKFRDGTEHKRVDCETCGQFQGYEKLYPGYDKLLIKDLPMDTDTKLSDLLSVLHYKVGVNGDDPVIKSNHSVTLILKVRSNERN